MTIKDVLTHQSKRLVSHPTLLRWMTNDRVMRTVNGILDRQQRIQDASEKLREAWHLLLNGRTLPSTEPALDEKIPTVSASAPAPEQPPAPTKAPPGATPVNVAHTPLRKAASQGDDLAASIASRTSLAGLGGRDVFEKCFQFTTTENARKMGVYPYFRPLDKNDGPEAILDGRRVLMLGSNNYLGLTTHPKVRQAAEKAIREYGTSMTGSRLVNGSMKMHRELEEKLAAFLGKEAALVFTAGYQVNLATLAALLSNKKSVAVLDRNDHASIYDGVRLGQAAGARMVRYKHNDPQSLERCLSELATDEGALVITDGVFSTEGEILRLPEMLPIVKKYGARIFLDDAHALGVIGPGGRGTAHHFGLADQVDLIGGTFSKSLASIGGWLVGDPKVLEYIKHFAPSFMFAASAAPPCVAAAMAALEVMQEEPWRIQKLGENAEYMRRELRRLGFDIGKSETSIIPIYIREDLRTILFWKELLEEHGVYTNPFISPGVPPRQAMLRTSYMATHTREHLDRGLEAFEKAGKKFGVIGAG
ncbi:MAG: aminotransferase class I/II-fold pyridoxal phosphate-dependent enzyme [Myxococcales bacterium]|nr:aminotransferase class I/II-fold pyridoxal phosphate-dependent enzyme [Polyangiaceae bacterium]MDW8248630.1 aminotransferase class I/II-fold pyridoxal phosphate-dependent enzyme [Myxococcales bacterium]